MHQHKSRPPLLLSAPSNAIPCDFNRVWLRMTARECLNVCTAYKLITSSPAIGDEPEQMPSDLSAEGALAWMSRNQGNGNYYFGLLIDPLAPKKITNVANMTLWLDGKDRATLLDGSDIPVNNGGKVATWTDKSGAGHDFTQATDGDRPHWYADGYVNFPGSPSTVQLNAGITWSNFISVNDSTIFLVVTVNAGASGNSQILGDNNGSFFVRWTGPIGAQSDAFQIRLTDGAGTTNVVSATPRDGTPYLLLLTRTTAPALEISLNGGEPNGASAAGTLGVGLSTHNMYLPEGSGLGRTKTACNIHEILIFNQDIGAADRDAIGRYLQAKWQIPWGINNLQYRSGLFGDEGALPIRAVQVRQALHAAYNHDPEGFLFHACGHYADRACELSREVPPAATGSLAPRTATNLLFWHSDGSDSPLDLLEEAYPEYLERDNLVRLEQAFFDQGTATENTYDVATVKTALEAQPDGRRWLKLGGETALWSQPPSTSGNTSGRYALYDQELSTAMRRGLSLEKWWEFQTDTSKNNFKKFFVALKAALAAGKTLDGIVIDVERWPALWRLQGRQGTLAFGDVLGDAQFRVRVSSIDSGTGVITTDGDHEFEVDQRLAYVSVGALPANLSDSRLYYVKSTPSDTTLTISETLGGATVLPGSSPLPSSVDQYVLRESLLHCMNDAAWDTPEGNLPAGVRGLLGPELDDNAWGKYQTLPANVGDVRFLFDAAMHEYYAGYIRRLADFARESFPELLVMDYDTHYQASHDYYFEYAEAFGAGVQPGVQALHLYGGTSTGSLDRRWNWARGGVEEVAGDADAAEREWSALVVQLMKLRRVTAASNSAAICPWLTTEVSQESELGFSGLWSELVLHCLLGCDGLLAFYQSSTDTRVFPAGYTDWQIATAQKKFVDVVAEADAVLAYASTRDPELTIDGVDVPLDQTRDDFDPGTAGPFAPAIAYARVYAGNRWVWRVTPNPTLPTTISQSDAGVRFDNEQGYLHVPRGTLHEASQSALAPLGYWVEQPPVCAA